jgi:hypothetical protein
MPRDVASTTGDYSGLGSGTASNSTGLGANQYASWNNQMTKSVFGVGNGLPSAWLSKMKAFTETSWWQDTLTAPSGSDLARDEWVDQIAIGYVASSEFAQNFRSSLNFGTTWDLNGDGGINRSAACAGDVTLCAALIDQRIEQGDTDMENINGLSGLENGGGEDAGYAFQTAFAGTSGPNLYANSTTGISNGDVKNQTGIADAKLNTVTVNVEQTTEGFFYACMNCNAIDNEHSFTPPTKLEFQTWPTRPKITKINHADAATQTTWNP